MNTRSDKRRAGFTLIEVTVATVVVGIALSAAITALGTAAMVKETLQDEPATAFTLAYEIQTLALTLPRGTWDGTPATRGSEIVVFEDFNGAVFNPPVNARRALRADLPDWSQDVALSRMSLDDPSASATVADGDAVLWQMDVVISKGAEQRGHFVWWIQP